MEDVLEGLDFVSNEEPYNVLKPNRVVAEGGVRTLIMTDKSGLICYERLFGLKGLPFNKGKVCPGCPRKDFRPLSSSIGEPRSL